MLPICYGNYILTSRGRLFPRATVNHEWKKKIKKKTQLEYLVNEKQVQRGFIPFDQISGLSPREPRVMNRLRGF